MEDAFPARFARYCALRTPAVKHYAEVGLTAPEVLNCVKSRDFTQRDPQVLSEVPVLSASVARALPVEVCFPAGFSASAESIDRDVSIFGFTLRTGGEELHGVALRFYDLYATGDGQWDCKPTQQARTVARTRIGCPLQSSPKNEPRTLGDALSFFKQLEIPKLRKQTSVPVPSRSEYCIQTPWSLEGQTRFRAGTNIDHFQKAEAVVVPRCIVLISTFPIFETMKSLLWALYEAMKADPIFPLECHVMHLLLNVPAPCSQVELLYSLQDCAFRLTVPPSNRLPLLDVNLGMLFSCLDLNNVLKVFKAVLMERSVAFVSRYEERLSDCALAIRGLIYPFKWQFAFFPVLPKAWIDYMWAPTRFIVGVSDQFKHDVLSRSTGNELVVDLDTNTVSSGCTLRLGGSLRTAAELPEHYGKKLAKRLSSTLREEPGCSAKSLRLAQATMTEATAEKVRMQFFQFFVSVLRQYRQFLGANSFARSCFVQTSAEADKPFLREFLASALFAEFCKTRANPVTAEQDCENKLFDEHIIAKLNRSKLGAKTKTPFIDDKAASEKKEFPLPRLEEFFLRVPTFSPYSKFPTFSYEFASTIDMPSMPAPPLPPGKEAAGGVECSHGSMSGMHSLMAAWMRVWALTLRSQHASELVDRVNELLSVQQRMKSCGYSLCEGCRRIVVEACISTSPSLSIPLFLDQQKMSVCSDTLQLFEKTILQQPAARAKSLAEARPLRSFSRSADPSDKRSVKLTVCSTCTHCEEHLEVSVLRAIWLGAEVEVACQACHRALVPSLRATVGEVTETVELLSPFELMRRVDSLPGDLALLRTKETAAFWSFVWHCQSEQLPFHLILPYETLMEVAEEESPAVVPFSPGGFTAALKSLRQSVETQTTIPLS